MGSTVLIYLANVHLPLLKIHLGRLVTIHNTINYIMLRSGNSDAEIVSLD